MAKRKSNQSSKSISPGLVIAGYWVIGLFLAFVFSGSNVHAIWWIFLLGALVSYQTVR